MGQSGVGVEYELLKVSAAIHSHRVMACFIFPGIDNAS